MMTSNVPHSSFLRLAALSASVLLVLAAVDTGAGACSAGCMKSSEMSRCLRITCRRHALGNVIRFGKRGRGGNARMSSALEGASPRSEVAESQSEEPSRAQLLLDELLHQGPYDRDRLQGGISSPDEKSFTPTHRAGIREGQLLQWMVQAVRNMRQAQLSHHLQTANDEDGEAQKGDLQARGTHQGHARPLFQHHGFFSPGEYLDAARALQLRRNKILNGEFLHGLASTSSLRDPPTFPYGERVSQVKRQHRLHGGLMSKLIRFG